MEKKIRGDGTEKVHRGWKFCKSVCCMA